MDEQLFLIWCYLFIIIQRKCDLHIGFNEKLIAYLWSINLVWILEFGCRGFSMITQKNGFYAERSLGNWISFIFEGYPSFVFILNIDEKE